MIYETKIEMEFASSLQLEKRAFVGYLLIHIQRALLE